MPVLEEAKTMSPLLPKLAYSRTDYCCFFLTAWQCDHAGRPFFDRNVTFNFKPSEYMTQTAWKKKLHQWP